MTDEHPEFWRRQAACLDAPDPDRFLAHSTPSRDARALAAEYCACCPVRTACLAHARATRSQGVWGGVWFPTPGTGSAVDLLAADPVGTRS